MQEDLEIGIRHTRAPDWLRLSKVRRIIESNILASIPPFVSCGDDQCFHHANDRKPSHQTCVASHCQRTCIIRGA